MCTIVMILFFPREERGKRISIILDMGNAGLSNVDIPFIGFLINLFKLYYPDMLNSIIVFEMPWIMNGELPSAADRAADTYNLHITDTATDTGTYRYRYSYRWRHRYLL